MITVTLQQTFLRTLSPLLRSLEKPLRSWLDGRRKHPVSLVQRAELEGLAEDLRRKSDALDVERPLLVVMLMGGTGVGKSTLMNALAGAAVAQASFTRPTTRDPVVYFHQSVNPDRLDPALRLCRLVRHNQESLAQKVLVDTPDVDSNDLKNRETLKELLPVADVVLYVGSQEKYHDQIGWDLFKEQRQRRAFAFVMNKWDRCLQDDAKGVRPDDDWIADLTKEGFTSPKLFRTTAQFWLDATANGETLPPKNLPPGEQFSELVEWLERGLTHLEIESVKARGVGQLLAQSLNAVEAVMPPELEAQADKTRESWRLVLADEARIGAEVLVSTLEPHQKEIEHQFRVRGQSRFRGLMAAYLGVGAKLRNAGSTLRTRVPFVPRIGTTEPVKDVQIDLSTFARDCARSAGERVLDRRTPALVNRLLLDADQRGFPFALLNEPTAAAGKLDWDERYSRCLVESLADVERESTAPVGWRAFFRGGVTLLANYLPEGVLLATISLLMWRFFVEDFTPSFFHILLPVYITLGVLVALHILITFAFPVSWPAIRDAFQAKLQGKLTAEFEAGYLPVPHEVAATIREERTEVAKMAEEIRTVAEWLNERETASHVGDLYGK